MVTFRQPDPTTCGSAVAVRARMLRDPAYDGWVREAADPAARFADEALRTHLRTNRVVGGAALLPWPRSLGTTPWALARELEGDHDVTLVTDREAAWRRLTTAIGPSVLYVGSGWLPRHVVLVHAGGPGPGGGRLTVYEPSAGVDVGVDHDAFVDARLGLGGWDRPWFTVTPAA